jgi:hypothetical protein
MHDIALSFVPVGVVGSRNEDFVTAKVSRSGGSGSMSEVAIFHQLTVAGRLDLPFRVSLREAK